MQINPQTIRWSWWVLSVRGRGTGVLQNFTPINCPANFRVLEVGIKRTGHQPYFRVREWFQHIEAIIRVIIHKNNWLIILQQFLNYFSLCGRCALDRLDPELLFLHGIFSWWKYRIQNILCLSLRHVFIVFLPKPLTRLLSGCGNLEMMSKSY